MKWQIRLEVKIDGDADAVEAFLDNVMEQLVDSGVEDPAVGAATATGATEIEFLVDGQSIEESQYNARDIACKMIPGIEIVGEVTRRAELVSA